MDTVWSENVQGVLTLYLSRKLRFDDMFFERYRELFGVDQNKKLKILEVGCGPGALAEALHRWYPEADIYGIDRDANFIAFAEKNVPGVSFSEGDATALPFDDNTFDVTISNTVQEHIEPTAFWSEQRRVLKPGGICVCLSSRKGINCTADCLAPSEAEKTFWADQPDAESDFEKYGVCRYPMSKAGLPESMEKHGFKNVTTGYAVIDLTPDDPKYPGGFAEAIIESDRQCELEAVASVRSDAGKRIAAAVNERYDKRIGLYRAGVKQWDTTVCVIMALRGEK